MSKIYDELKSAEQARRGSHVGAGVQIKGEVTGSEDLVADGRIEGPVRLTDGTLSIGETGSVKGDVTAKQVVVHGAVIGNVEGREKVEIRATGSIVGDIVTSRIVIDEGAQCKGSIDIGRNNAEAARA